MPPVPLEDLLGRVCDSRGSLGDCGRSLCTSEGTPRESNLGRGVPSEVRGRCGERLGTPPVNTAGLESLRLVDRRGEGGGDGADRKSVV